LIREARLVVTTVHQAFLSPLLAESRFDVLIVDEASMVQPVALYLAAGLAKRSIVAGDFRQLPPVVCAKSVSANAWLRRDAFEAAGIPDDVKRGDYPPYLVVLTQQYRISEGICSLVAAAYDAGLTTDHSVHSRPDRTPRTARCLLRHLGVDGTR
jgi:superfamily I DNA and/or RNA helicase